MPTLCPVSPKTPLRHFNFQLYLRVTVLALFLATWAAEGIPEVIELSHKYGAKVALIHISLFLDMAVQSLSQNMRTRAIMRNIRHGIAPIAVEEHYAFESERVAEVALRRLRTRRGTGRVQPDELLPGTRVLLFLYRAGVVTSMGMSAALMNHLPSGQYIHNIYAAAVFSVATALFMSDSLAVVLLLAPSLFLEDLEGGTNDRLFFVVVFVLACTAVVGMVFVSLFDVLTVRLLLKASAERASDEGTRRANLLQAVPVRGRCLGLAPLLAAIGRTHPPRARLRVATFDSENTDPGGPSQSRQRVATIETEGTEQVDRSQTPSVRSSQHESNRAEQTHPFCWKIYDEPSQASSND